MLRYQRNFHGIGGHAGRFDCQYRRNPRAPTPAFPRVLAHRRYRWPTLMFNCHGMHLLARNASNDEKSVHAATVSPRSQPRFRLALSKVVRSGRWPLHIRQAAGLVRVRRLRNRRPPCRFDSQPRSFPLALCRAGNVRRFRRVDPHITLIHETDNSAESGGYATPGQINTFLTSTTINPNGHVIYLCKFGELSARARVK